MLTEAASYDELYRNFRWDIPDRFNLATACWPCNLGKGTRTGWEYRCRRLLCGR